MKVKNEEGIMIEYGFAETVLTGFMISMMPLVWLMMQIDRIFLHHEESSVSPAERMTHQI